MTSDFVPTPDSNSSPNPTTRQTSSTAKLPKPVLSMNGSAPTVFAFPPNRDTLGGTAYLIVENDTRILVDCPAWNQGNLEFCQQYGSVEWLFITHRGGIGQAQKIQQDLGCQILIQEQEAYLLPGLAVTSFRQDFPLTPHIQAVWTPGHSPGSSCLYYDAFGGVLFSGRHLLPNLKGLAVPLKTSKTFHWRRQLNSVRSLRDRFSPDTLHVICPGANIGFLRGEGFIPDAYAALETLDLTEDAMAKG
jgi:glyoxylase-like metal-dependent hydrolase (beta-lactamase superfamily II)